MKKLLLLLTTYSLLLTTASGQNWMWGQQGFMKGPNGYTYTESCALAEDLNKNVFIAGGFADTLFMGKYMFRSDSNKSKMFLAKYDENGNLLWALESTGSRQGNFAYGFA